VDPWITRPTKQLLGYLWLALEAGESAVMRFVVPTTRLAFSDRDLVRLLSRGDVELWVGPCWEGRFRISGHTH